MFPVWRRVPILLAILYKSFMFSLTSVLLFFSSPLLNFNYVNTQSPALYFQLNMDFNNCLLDCTIEAESLCQQVPMVAQKASGHIHEDLVVDQLTIFERHEQEKMSWSRSILLLTEEFFCDWRKETEALSWNAAIEGRSEQTTGWNWQEGTLKPCLHFSHIRTLFCKGEPWS